jgi:hypothetical protein
MRIARLFAAVLSASVLISAAVHADPFDPKTIPADAKWVVHIDVDAARHTKSFGAFCDQVLANENVRGKLDQIKDFTGLDIPDDVNDVTLYGKAAGPDAGVVIVHGKLDEKKTVDSLSMADQFESKKYGDYDVYTWLDKDKNQIMWGAFHGDSVVIIGHSEEKIDDTLDAMDGKGDSLKGDSTLAKGRKPQVLIYVAAKDIPQLHGPADKPNPVTSAIQSAWVSLTEKADVIILSGELQAATSDNAANLRSLLEGVRGMLGVAASSDNADPVAKAVVAADKSFTTTQTDNVVSVDWPVQLDQFKAIIKAIADKQANANR